MKTGTSSPVLILDDGILGGQHAEGCARSDSRCAGQPAGIAGRLGPWLEALARFAPTRTATVRGSHAAHCWWRRVGEELREVA